MTFLEVLLSYLINLASGERSAAIADSRQRKLNEALEQEDALRKALSATRSLREEVRATCIELARNRTQLGVTPGEEPVWRLLSDDIFQADLAEWLMAGAIDEGNEAKKRLLSAMELALSDGVEKDKQIAFLKSDYFDAVEKSIYSNPIIANWRHQLSLDYLREQVAVLRQHAEEAAGVFSPQKQQSALDRYCEKALTAWDIIDLSNLPEGDIHMATQKLLLRQLYMPLRIEVELTRSGDGNDAMLARMEEERETRRRREAGHFVTDEPERQKTRAPVGERLAASRRLVVLGDPGGGKTTMLRWMATAYLLRHKEDDAFTQVPDTQTLPGLPWVPAFIRCRDLGEVDLCRCFVDFLTQHLNKTELLPDEAEIMRAVILDRFAKGEALLLVDGLDEITNPHVRMMFCQELERTAARYPDAPIVVTSRIVGYRDMPYRMGSGFEHGQIAELTREDKDLFASRWVDVTEQHQPPQEKTKRVQDLFDALHSNDRIERLTGNPMLLTTLALVKRKVGKLPNKRTKLYAEAVSVLLNWNPRIFQVIEEDEAIPQLEYLAYEMCRRGVQRLSDDDVLDLLEKLRFEYPNIRAIKRREPQAFLKHLEERSSILIKSGGIWQRNMRQEKQVWEFRHLTFQEYLAARALLDGRYPGREKTKTLAAQVRPLAGAVQKAKTQSRATEEEEHEVPESWREALRLLVADCKDDDVDEVLLGVLNPTEGEDHSKTTRPRSALAALCLADEPNISEETAAQIVSRLIANVEERDCGGRIKTSLSFAAAELGKSMWAPLLKTRLLQEFRQNDPSYRWQYGSLWAMVESSQAPDKLNAFEKWFAGLASRLQADDEIDNIAAALVVMETAFLGKACEVSQIPESLLALLKLSPPVRFAAAWALGRLCIDTPSHWKKGETIWRPRGGEVDILTRMLQLTEWKESDTLRWLVTALSYGNDARAVQPIISCLGHEDATVRESVAQALKRLGDRQAVAPLLAKLNDPNTDVRREVIEALVQLSEKQAIAPLLTKLNDPDSDVRQAVIEVLVRLGDKQAVPPLLTKLNDPDSDVLRAVIEALGQLGDKQAVPLLLTNLNDLNPDIRRTVIEVLVRLGDKQAVPPLQAKLNDPDTDVRRAVIEALGQLGDTQTVTPLLAKLNDPDTDVRRAVIGALGQLGDKQAVPSLLPHLNDPDTDVRRAVIEALGQLGDTQAIAPLLPHLNDPDHNIRRIVIEALGQLGDTQAIAPLLPHLNAKEDGIAVAAAAALRILGQPNHLAQFLVSERAQLRRAVVRACALQRDNLDQQLLSRDLDATGPWLDPQEPITQAQVANASMRLGITPEQVRLRYEAMAEDLKLILGWKPQG